MLLQVVHAMLVKDYTEAALITNSIFFLPIKCLPFIIIVQYSSSFVIFPLILLCIHIDIRSFSKQMIFINPSVNKKKKNDFQSIAIVGFFIETQIMLSNETIRATQKKKNENMHTKIDTTIIQKKTKRNEAFFTHFRNI